MIKLCRLHPWNTNIESFIRSLKLEGLPCTEQFIWDDENPDYLFVSEHIYSNREYAEKFKRLAEKAKILIYHAGECIAPDLNIFDYAIVFDKKLSDMDRIASMPTHINFRTCINGNENHLTLDEARSLLKSRKRFCNFIYSNNNAHHCRNELFYALSGYKRVDSLGRCLNNIGTLISAGNTYGGGGIRWPELSIRIKSMYKFSIASENAQYEGYTSEKLLTSFNAHTVPVYWGNKYVSELFNPEAFIDCNNYDSFDDVVRRVREVDEDDDLWAYMVSQPWQTDEQRAASEREYEDYRNFIMNIFSQPISEAVRRPEGFWPGRYRKWFFNRETCIVDTHDSIFMGFLKLLKEMLRRIYRKFKGAVRKILGKNNVKKLPETDINDFFSES